MRTARLASTLILLSSLAAAAFATTITGTVTNGTTGRPAGGTTVTLLDPMAGMLEVGTVKTDAAGQFSIEAPAARGPRLVRAERGGVNYFTMITPGSDSAQLSVYDAASSVEGIKGAADVVRAQAQDSTLHVLEMFAISNGSQPPRALAAAKTFEFVLPDGAQVDEARAQAPNGQPISVPTKPTGEKNHYAFAFALKPGETRLQVDYHLPYSGQASFSPHFTRNFEHFVLLLPSAMSFTAKDPSQYQAMNNQPGTNVEVSVQAEAGKDISYSIAGSGTFPDESQSQNADAAPPANGRAPTARPGGGLGVPIDAPDGLTTYRWYILAVLCTILIGGGIWTHERTAQEAVNSLPSAISASPAPALAARKPAPAAAVATPAQPPAPSNLLLTALKEELFTLEIEHQQGKLSKDDYEKARAALEQTLQRALARNNS